MDSQNISREGSPQKALRAVLHKIHMRAPPPPISIKENVLVGGESNEEYVDGGDKRYPHQFKLIFSIWLIIILREIGFL